MIYFRCYIENYDGDTRDLSMMEDGAYGRLLRHYYSTELPIPLDSDKVARICKAITLEERAAIESVLDRYFIRQPDGWHNKRADTEINVANTARANGSRGGRPGNKTEDETQTITGSQTKTATGSETQTITGTGHPSSRLAFNPTTPSTSQPSNQLPSARSRSRPAETGATWEAYCGAFKSRYGVDPVRNARVNGQLASLVRCVGATEAPGVAAFFVAHNRSVYVQAKHSTSLLARDAEGLRTEWATGTRVSETEARQADRTMATGNAFGALIDAARAKVSS